MKYFSGTGDLHQDHPGSARSGSRPARGSGSISGDVKNIAEVSVSGKPLGVAWKPPFRVDVTRALKPGANSLEIKVTNLWVNRLIGDQQPNAPVQYTFTRPEFYRADSPLLPSGLLGPVRIVQERRR